MVDERRFLNGTAATGTDLPETALQRPIIDRPALILARIEQVARKAGASLDRSVREEYARGTAFLLVPVLLAGGAAGYFAAPSEPIWSVLLVALLVLSVMRFTIRNNGPAALALNVAILILLGALCAKVETERHHQVMLGGPVSTTGTGIVRYAEKSATGMRIVLDLQSTADPVLKYSPTGIRLVIRGQKVDLKAGDSIKARMHLQPSTGPLRPSGYDFAFQSWFDDIGATGFVSGAIALVERAEDPDLKQGLERLRQHIAERIRSRLPGDRGEIAVALLAGVQGGISRQTADEMRVSGLSHILSISGLHMALVAGVFLYGIRGAVAVLPDIAQRIAVKKIAAVAAFIACLIYLAISGAEVATVRSFIMIATMLAAIVLDRPALTMRNLVIAATIIIVLTPHEIMGPSFQMSFAATGALIAGYQQWSTRRATSAGHRSFGMAGKIAGLLGRGLAATAATSVIAGLATALFSAWHFNRLAPLGLIANVLATLPVSLLVMPFGILALILMPLHLEGFALDVMGVGIGAMIAIAGMVSELTPDNPLGSLSSVAFVAGILTLTLLLLLQTRMRMLALLPFIAAALHQTTIPAAMILISEDAALVAVRLENGLWATNRKRPNRFTAEIWKRSLAVNSFVPPKPTPHDQSRPGEALATPVRSEGKGEAFYCNGLVCTVLAANGMRIVWMDYPKTRVEIGSAEKHENADPADTSGLIAEKNQRAEIAAFTRMVQNHCEKADILIVNGPLARTPCHQTGIIVMDAKTLAMNGSVVMTDKNSDIKIGTANDRLKYGHTKRIDWRYAVGEPERPWNRERRFSRAARNKPPYVPKPQPDGKRTPKEASEGTEEQGRSRLQNATPASDYTETGKTNAFNSGE